MWPFKAFWVRCRQRRRISQPKTWQNPQVEERALRRASQNEGSHLGFVNKHFKQIRNQAKHSLQGPGGQWVQYQGSQGLWCTQRFSWGAYQSAQTLPSRLCPHDQMGLSHD